MNFGRSSALHPIFYSNFSRDPRFIREFKSKYCVEVFAEHLPTKKKSVSLTAAFFILFLLTPLPLKEEAMAAQGPTQVLVSLSRVRMNTLGTLVYYTLFITRVLYIPSTGRRRSLNVFSILIRSGLLMLHSPTLHSILILLSSRSLPRLR